MTSALLVTAGPLTTHCIPLLGDTISYDCSLLRQTLRFVEEAAVVLDTRFGVV